jgi:hypothetical protein
MAKRPPHLGITRLKTGTLQQAQLKLELPEQLGILHKMFGVIQKL